MVTLSRHPLLRQCYDVMQQIEACGASLELTKAVTMAGELLDGIDAALPNGEAAAIEAARQARTALREALVELGPYASRRAEDAIAAIDAALDAQTVSA
jgi:hypothetical protein